MNFRRDNEGGINFGINSDNIINKNYYNKYIESIKSIGKTLAFTAFSLPAGFAYLTRNKDLEVRIAAIVLGAGLSFASVDVVQNPQFYFDDNTVREYQPLDELMNKGNDFKDYLKILGNYAVSASTNYSIYKGLIEDDSSKK